MSDIHWLVCGLLPDKDVGYPLAGVRMVWTLETVAPLDHGNQANLDKWNQANLAIGNREILIFGIMLGNKGVMSKIVVVW